MSNAAFLTAQNPALEKITHHSIKDTIAERFATLIASGVLGVGDSFPSERDLAATMGVSRETIRGALLILSNKGIVNVVQGARTKVASADVGDLGMSALTSRLVTDYKLEDVHEARLMVEARVAVLAAQQVEPETLEHLAALIKAQESATDDPVKFLITDREFHTLIYQSCGNAVLSDLATTLYSYLLDHRRHIVGKSGVIAQSIEDHRLILSALRAQDGAALAHALGVHEHRIYDTTRALLAASNKKETPCA
ncbi:DNA-binding FadR family transcriptional regulator [Sulfitobacter undariae]|uniref:DNA-binding FadR family transcriptional regulator n=1 Tax=Sulfitobacter undariae TaxID=1563671 RepID=A0A7W6H0J9_9RHOB|nr:FCD domain-containing protein [Sulfitobacter undariae]MBB3992779.1 DNA-binding FadR family transcriptional regulator [Sulfitobacter undariae]